MAKINKGENITGFQDIERLVLFYCKITKSYTAEDIYKLVRKDLNGSRFIVGKRLYKMIEEATNKLIDKGLLFENNGHFYHQKIKLVKVENSNNLTF